jgi:hypothetical protein
MEPEEHTTITDELGVVWSDLSLLQPQIRGFL